MRLIDEKGRIFGKVSIIDIGIIVVLGLFLAGIYVKGNISVVREIKAAPQKLQVSILISELRQPSVDAIEEGIPVWEGKTGPYLGTLIKKDVQPAVKWVDAADGRVVQTTIPGKYDVTITIEGEGVMDEKTTLLGNAEMRVGSTVYVKGGKFSVMGVVVKAVKVE